jgi:hypothetical protein
MFGKDKNLEQIDKNLFFFFKTCPLKRRFFVNRFQLLITSQKFITKRIFSFFMAIWNPMVSLLMQFILKKLGIKIELKSTHALGILALFLILLLIMNTFLFDMKTELTSLFSLGLIGALIIVIIVYVLIKIYTKRNK